MKTFRQHGVSVMLLSDIADQFCLTQGNMRESMYTSVIVNARWAWKDIFRDTLWFTKKAVLCVDKKTRTTKLPADCEKVINIQVVDGNGRLHPLTFNPDINTARIRCMKTKCSCNNCNGDDTLCGAIDAITVTYQTVTIKGTDYTQSTYVRYDGTGNMQREIISPVLDAKTNTVIFQTRYETICQVETTEKGCIKTNGRNIELLNQFFGLGNFLDEWTGLGYGWDNWNAFRTVAPPSYNKYGYFNYNAAAGDIVHIEPPHKHFWPGWEVSSDQPNTEFRDFICQVVVEYLTNGEVPGEEILVPEYAVEAVEEGIFYRQKRFNTRVSPADKNAAKASFEDAKIKVMKYLNPIRIDTVAKLQTQPRPW